MTADRASDRGPSLTADEHVLRIRAALPTDAVDVHVNGHRVWSIDPAEHPPVDDGTRYVPWPAALSKRLDGEASVELRNHRSGEVIASARCRFRSGEGIVDLRDKQGRLLSLSKWGRLNESFSDIRRQELDWYLDRTDEVLATLADHLAVPAFVAYGTLLGAVRSGRLIGHDMDVDLGYVSRAETPADAMRESFDIERELRRRGWLVRRQGGGFLQVFVKPASGPARNIDVFTGWLDSGADRYYMINDTAIEMRRDELLPLGTIELEGRSFPAPGAPERLLEAAYGPTWRVPDPNFSYGMTPGKKQMRHWTGGLREDRDRWSRLYAAEPEVVPRAPTEFGRWARDLVGGADAVFDVGCGLGRDTLHLAELHPVVVGIDAAGPAVRRAQRRARRAGSAATFRKVNLCSLRESVAVGALLRRSFPGRHAIVARHLLDALSPAGIDGFWALSTSLLSPGGRCLLEYTTDPSVGEFVEFPGMPRHALEPEKVAEDARLRGAVVCDQEQVIGGGAQSCRMILEWT